MASGPSLVHQGTKAPEGIAVSINGGTTRPVPWAEGMTVRVGSNFLTFRGGDLHLSGSSPYSVLKEAVEGQLHQRVSGSGCRAADCPGTGVHPY